MVFESALNVARYSTPYPPWGAKLKSRAVSAFTMAVKHFGVVFRSRLGQVHARRYAPSCTMCRLTCSIEDGISGPSFAALVGRACEANCSRLRSWSRVYKRHCYGRGLAAESKRRPSQLHAVYCWIVIR
jgi:hypothetical protein